MGTPARSEEAWAIALGGVPVGIWKVRISYPTWLPACTLTAIVMRGETSLTVSIANLLPWSCNASA